MNTVIRNYVNSVSRRSLTSNTARALHTLLTAEGDRWVSRSSMRLPSCSARIRDLRQDSFGNFDVECRSASALGKNGSRTTFFYRLDLRNVTLAQVRAIFEGV